VTLFTPILVPIQLPIEWKPQVYHPGHKANWIPFRAKFNKTGNVLVTFRRIRATSVVVEKQSLLHILIVCIFNLKDPASIAHAPFCHLWPAPLYNIFPHYLTKNKIFENKKY
jgi:hypothetical protein